MEAPLWLVLLLARQTSEAGRAARDWEGSTALDTALTAAYTNAAVLLQKLGCQELYRNIKFL